MMKSVKSVIIVGVAVALFSGCSTPLKTRGVETSGFLSNYEQLEKGARDQAHLRYIDQEADLSVYTKILMDPVTVRVIEGSKLEKLNEKNLKALVDYCDASIRAQLVTDFEFVKEPGPDVLRLRVAITDGKRANVTLNTASSIIPIGMAVDVVKWAAVGAHASVGEASMEGELVDSVSGKRLIAAVDSRAGRKSVVSGNFTRWGDTKDAFDHWAKGIRLLLTPVEEQTAE